MIYLYLGEKSVKLLALTKTFMRQYKTSVFVKSHNTELLKDGAIVNSDVTSSAIKEALTLATPESPKDKDIYLVLPQNAFTFARYDIPPDIKESAILPFIADKARADFKFDLDTALSDFLVVQQDNASTVMLYVIKQETATQYLQALNLLGLQVKAIVPETVTYFKLFEKTLKQNKRERILYVSYGKDGSSGYLFDSLGLVEGEEHHFEGELKDALAKFAKERKEEEKIDRIILSGDLSGDIRQDLFTKDVGVWTNPLDKIISNFYQDYLKLLVPPDSEGIPALSMDACLGAFILHRENSTFSLYKNGGKLPDLSGEGPKFNFGGWIKGILLFIFVIILTFGAMYGLDKVMSGSFGGSDSSKPIPTVVPTTTQKPTSAPEVDKESVKIRVLNGTGTAGRAGEMQEILKDLGYVDVLTGNAEESDVEQTSIEAKEKFASAAAAIAKDLEETIEIKKSNISTTLDEDDNADVVIIVGTDFE